MPPRPSLSCPVDLSVPDNTELVRGRPLLIEALWFFVAAPIVRSSWIPSSGLRTRLLRLFGAEIGQGVYFKPGIRVKFPWYLKIGDYSWIGENCWIDNLALVTIGKHACISQGAYLCTGNHDWSSRNMRLFRKPITIHDGAWVGAFSVVSPGITVGKCAIAALGSVLMKDIPEFEVHAGNPAEFVRQRQIRS